MIASTLVALAAAPPPPDITLAVVVFAPLVGAGIIAVLPVETDLQRFRVRVTALGAALVSFLVCGFDFFGVLASAGLGGLPQPQEQTGWLPGIPGPVGYNLGGDGVNFPLLFVATILLVALVLASWRVRDRTRLHFGLLLFSAVGLLGALAAYDLGLLVLFFAWPVAPVVLLVRQGGGARAAAAARRLLVSWLLSCGLLALAALLLALRASGHPTLDLSTLTTDLTLPRGVSTGVFALVVAACVLRMGLVPAHLPLIDAVGAAGTPVAMLTVGSGLLTGGYTLARVALDGAPRGADHLATPLLGLAVLTMLWGAFGAYAVQELRRLSGYVVVCLGGLVVLGMVGYSETSIAGALYLLLAATLAVPLLLLVVGAVTERTRTRRLAELGGCGGPAPRLSLLWVAGAAGVLGIPLLAGFPALLQVFAGTFPEHRYGVAIGCLALLVLGAALFRAGTRVFLGPPGENVERLRDAQGSELYAGAVLVAFLLLFGLGSGRFLPYMVNGTDLVSGRLAAVAPAVVLPALGLAAPAAPGGAPGAP